MDTTTDKINLFLTTSSRPSTQQPYNFLYNVPNGMITKEKEQLFQLTVSAFYCYNTFYNCNLNYNHFQIVFNTNTGILYNTSGRKRNPMLLSLSVLLILGLIGVAVWEHHEHHSCHSAGGTIHVHSDAHLPATAAHTAAAATPATTSPTAAATAAPVVAATPAATATAPAATAPAATAPTAAPAATAPAAAGN